MSSAKLKFAPWELSSSERVGDANQAEQQAIFRVFLSTVQHFFGGFARLFQSLTDPRDPTHVRYPLAALCCEGVLLFLCRLGSRRQLTHLLRDNGAVAQKFQALFGVAGCAHGDTLNALCTGLDPAEMQTVLSGMSAQLIRQKVLYPYRLRGHYYVVGIDGTGTLSFSQRHCEHCLTRTSNGQTLYYHTVLEAKLLTPNGFAFSLMSEFVENPDANPDKQDCELKAFTRLSARLKQRFPRLPICLTLDALFACGATLARCQQYGWKYLIVLKPKDLPKVSAEFEVLAPLSPGAHLQVHSGQRAEIDQDFRWVNAIDYVDSERRAHTLAVITCHETKPDSHGQPQTSHFQWITNFKVKTQNVLDLATHGGRIRWKEENEGFNTQKHGGFALEHVFSQNYIAAQIFYFFLQIAHLLFQLMEQGSLFRHAFPKGVGSAKNIAFRLLEAWRNLRLSAQAWQQLSAARFQIRFDSS
jgi:hypothetical protein